MSASIVRDGRRELERAYKDNMKRHEMSRMGRSFDILARSEDLTLIYQRIIEATMKGAEEVSSSKSGTELVKSLPDLPEKKRQGFWEDLFSGRFDGRHAFAAGAGLAVVGLGVTSFYASPLSAAPRAAMKAFKAR